MEKQQQQQQHDASPARTITFVGHRAGGNSKRGEPRKAWTNCVRFTRRAKSSQVAATSDTLIHTPQQSFLTGAAAATLLHYSPHWPVPPPVLSHLSSSAATLRPPHFRYPHRKEVPGPAPARLQTNRHHKTVNTIPRSTQASCCRPNTRHKFRLYCLRNITLPGLIDVDTTKDDFGADS